MRTLTRKSPRSRVNCRGPAEETSRRVRSRGFVSFVATSQIEHGESPRHDTRRPLPPHCPVRPNACARTARDRCRQSSTTIHAARIDLYGRASVNRRARAPFSRRFPTCTIGLGARLGRRARGWGFEKSATAGRFDLLRIMERVEPPRCRTFLEAPPARSAPAFAPCAGSL